MLNSRFACGIISETATFAASTAFRGHISGADLVSDYLSKMLWRMSDFCAHSNELDICVHPTRRQWNILWEFISRCEWLKSKNQFVGAGGAHIESNELWFLWCAIEQWPKVRECWNTHVPFSIYRHRVSLHLSFRSVRPMPKPATNASIECLSDSRNVLQTTSVWYLQHSNLPLSFLQTNGWYICGFVKNREEKYSMGIGHTVKQVNTPRTHRLISTKFLFFRRQLWNVCLRSDRTVRWLCKQLIVENK